MGLRKMTIDTQQIVFYGQDIFLKRPFICSLLNGSFNFIKLEYGHTPVNKKKKVKVALHR